MIKTAERSSAAAARSLGCVPVVASQGCCGYWCSLRSRWPAALVLTRHATSGSTFACHVRRVHTSRRIWMGRRGFTSRGRRMEPRQGIRWHPQEISMATVGAEKIFLAFPRAAPWPKSGAHKHTHTPLPSSSACKPVRSRDGWSNMGGRGDDHATADAAPCRDCLMPHSPVESRANPDVYYSLQVSTTLWLASCLEALGLLSGRAGSTSLVATKP